MIARLHTQVAIAIAFLLLSATVSAHTVITYPGWRGDNLLDDGYNTPLFDQTGGLGVGPNDTYPYGRQWIYPCMTVPEQ